MKYNGHTITFIEENGKDVAITNGNKVTVTKGWKNKIIELNTLISDCEDETKREKLMEELSRM
jgi:short-subunit dehydrogenase involved in D-alanine esterification of teichoic acids